MDMDLSVVGHWRNTDSMDGGGVAVVTDTHYDLDNNGRFEFWVKSRSAGFDQGDSLKTYGHWETREGRLYFTFDSGEAFSTAYTRCREKPCSYPMNPACGFGTGSTRRFAGFDHA